MELKKQRNTWSCLLTAFSMVLDVSEDDLINDIGHDGSSIVWPQLDDPFCRQGFHIQELIDCCYKRQLSVTPIEMEPVSMSAVDYEVQLNQMVITGKTEEIQNIINKAQAELVTHKTINKVQHHDRMEKYLKNNIGVLYGQGLSGNIHAVAWNGEKIYDPNGTMYKIGRYFDIHTFYIIRRSKCMIINQNC